MQSDFHQRIQTDPPQLAGRCVSPYYFPSALASKIVCFTLPQFESARIFHLIRATCPNHVALLDVISLTTSNQAVLMLSPPLLSRLTTVHIVASTDFYFLLARGCQLNSLKSRHQWKQTTRSNLTDGRTVDWLTVLGAFWNYIRFGDFRKGWEF